jgi:hypothetical protein
MGEPPQEGQRDERGAARGEKSTGGSDRQLARLFPADY